jgi:hypothetical protein
MSGDSDAENLRVGPYVRPRHAAAGEDGAAGPGATAAPPDAAQTPPATGRATVKGRARPRLRRRTAVGRAQAPGALPLPGADPPARHGPRTPEVDPAADPPADGSLADTRALVPVSALVGADRPEAPRAGPEVLESDSWDTAVEPDAVDTYHGRRRAVMGPRWLGLALVFGALAALVAVPLTLMSLRDPDPAAAPSASASLDGPVVDPTVSADATLDPTAPPTTMSAVSRPPVAGTTRPPRRPPTRTSAAPRPSTGGGVTTAAVPPAAPPPPPPFNPVSIEAEAGGAATTLGGSAWAWNYANASGGRIVRNVGDWGSRSGPGSVRFNGVTVPSTGRYEIAVHYVHPDNESTRRAVITVSGAAAVDVTFSGTSSCCRVKVITVTMSAGTHTVTIANSSGRAPSIDKIVVSR